MSGRFESEISSSWYKALEDHVEAWSSVTEQHGFE